MIRFYSLFVVSDEQPTDPRWRWVESRHDLSLIKDEREIIQLSLPPVFAAAWRNRVEVIFDPADFQIEEIVPQQSEDEYIAAVTLTPLRSGSRHLGFGIKHPMQPRAARQFRRPLRHVPVVAFQPRSAPVLMSQSPVASSYTRSRQDDKTVTESSSVTPTRSWLT